MSDCKSSTQLVLIKRVEEYYTATNKDTQNKDGAVQTNAVPCAVTSYPTRQKEIRTETMFNPRIAPVLTISLLCVFLMGTIWIVSVVKTFDTWWKWCIGLGIFLVFLSLVSFVSWKCFQSNVVIEKTIEYSCSNKN